MWGKFWRLTEVSLGRYKAPSRASKASKGKVPVGCALRMGDLESCLQGCLTIGFSCLETCQCFILAVDTALPSMDPTDSFSEHLSHAQRLENLNGIVGEAGPWKLKIEFRTPPPKGSKERGAQSRRKKLWGNSMMEWCAPQCGTEHSLDRSYVLGTANPRTQTDASRGATSNGGLKHSETPEALGML